MADIIHECSDPYPIFWLTLQLRLCYFTCLCLHDISSRLSAATREQAGGINEIVLDLITQQKCISAKH